MGFEILNIEELGFKIEAMILRGARYGSPPKLSQLFLVCGNDEEAEFDKELGGPFLENLRLNLFDKDPKLVEFVDTTKIKVFFSKDCIKYIQEPLSGGLLPKFTKFLLDHRKFSYPRLSIPSARPFKPINNKTSNIN